MAIADFYENFNLSYKAPTTARDGADINVTYGAAVSFDGYITQLNANERAMAGTLGVRIDYKLRYDPSVTIPDNARISDGTVTYEIVSLPSQAKNRFDIGQSSLVDHKRDYLKVASRENL